MRILHVNKFLYRRGGAEAYMQDVAELQSGVGHTVAYFGMAHPANPALTYAAHFPSFVEFGGGGGSSGERLRAAARMLYSSSAARGMAAVMDDFRPDVVHLHNIYHQLSPSILRPVARRGVPAVMTLHDYKLACPSYQMLDHGRVCEACLGGRFHRAARRRCKDGSLAASTLLAVESYAHSLTRAYDPVGVFICPSRFMAAKMAQAGVFPDRLRHLSHFVDGTTMPARLPPGGRLLYAGRLSEEKGVDVLIEALARLESGAELVVAGEGPARAVLQARADDLVPGRVRFAGRLAREEVLALMAESAALVVPSRWHENQPMVVLEAFACGLPVVGTALGGIAELIDDGVTGAVVPAGDPDALAGALAALLAAPGRALAMGRVARRRVRAEFRPGDHLRRLEQLYSEASLARRPAA